ncbi:DUF1593 domain-containing protein [Aquiflexum sp. TKW24L]|uniref:nucleoside hydrolase-like domain-containing protein n=1 Tax=Aquiflexum sp. TKW24L TaxID=2942212 RepID=UPI0020BF9AF2|nr:nucleoside hydrolase-like domain-containing protein [Aquiflexum sp. TKW24L]MCL6261254.1 DUF1593 domain-containing protein [Aquiflexum sp. TKW24L]
MKPIKPILFLFGLLLIGCNSSEEKREKYRVVIMTDMTHDDGNSLIRMLYYPEVFDIDGMVITQQLPDYDFDAPEPWEKGMNILAAYRDELPQLKKHALDFPSYEELLSKTKKGRGALVINFLQEGQRFHDYIGEGINPNGESKDSEGSEYLMEVFEKEDDRPIYVQLWGGPITLVQALYRYNQKFGEEKFEKLLGKIFIYGILLQDITSDYFVDLAKLQEQNCIDLNTYQKEEGYQGKRAQVGTFIYDDGHFWDYLKAVNYKEVNGHGKMSNIYDGGGEGDTPSFLYLISAYLGLNDPLDPTMGSWGGKFIPMDESYGKNYFYTCGLGKEGLTRWIEPATNSFFARLDWSVKEPNEINHEPIACLDGDSGNSIVYKKVKAGEKIQLDASCSSDPDEDPISFKWDVYPEAGTYPGDLQIGDSGAAKIEFTIPEDFPGKELNLILEVKDSGYIPLTSYRRIVFSS